MSKETGGRRPRGPETNVPRAEPGQPGPRTTRPSGLGCFSNIHIKASEETKRLRPHSQTGIFCGDQTMESSPSRGCLGHVDPAVFYLFGLFLLTLLTYALENNFMHIEKSNELL